MAGRDSPDSRSSSDGETTRKHKRKHKSKDKHKEKSSHKLKDKDRIKDREGRDRDGGRGRSRSRERRRSRSRGHDAAAGGSGKRERERGTSADRKDSKRAREEAAAGGRSGSAAAAAAAATKVAADPEAARKAEMEAEQRSLDDEMERRRKRVEAWQAARRQKQEAEEAARAAALAALNKTRAGGTGDTNGNGAGKGLGPGAADAGDGAGAEAAGGGRPKKGDGAKSKGWSLEDDDFGHESDDEDGDGGGGNGDVEMMMADANGDGGGGGMLVGAPKRIKKEDDDEDEVGGPGRLGGKQQAAVQRVGTVEIKKEIKKEEDGGGDAVDPLDAFMAGNNQEAAIAVAEAVAATDEEVDPLDAFMADQVLPEVQRLRDQPPPLAATTSAQIKQEEGEDGAGEQSAAGAAAGANGAAKAAGGAAAAAAAKRRKLQQRRPLRRRRPLGYDSDESSSSAAGTDEEEEKSEEEVDDEEWARNVRAGKSKGDKLSAVDHSTINYPPFRKQFYIEGGELARMTKEQTEEYRKELDSIKVRGKNVPKPIRNWNQAGLSSRVMEQLKKAGYEGPMPIQAQALPVIMSGRDCIGIAKTGSGKTLGFVLPMVRHVMDQPPLEMGDGPIALIMAPTRELVAQIGKEVRTFCKPMGLTTVNVYGGSGVANQISELKRGAEVVTCTPGRMIDVLATSSGKITNLRRVTYLVLDEADRMFDMGFEPQINRIVMNIRPDRQTVMFSATFPRQVEVLARKVLSDSAVEIQVGGRSVVNKDITQYIEIRPDEDRFLRLLEILGEWYEAGKTLVFVNSQDKADNLFRDLLRSGYPCLTLHGGKDQLDRESTLQDFKADVCNLLVATSVAARGLDVKELVLVVNYDPPNHHEDYIHRVGRTGRAGAKGTAITFIGPGEERYAPDLVKALRESGADVPKDLQFMADEFAVKRKAGLVQGHGSGFGGSGFKFDASEEAQKRADRKEAAKQYGMQGSDQEGSDDEGGGKDDTIKPAGTAAAAEQAAATAKAAAAVSDAPIIAVNGSSAQTSAPAPVQLTAPSGMPEGLTGEALKRRMAAEALAARMTALAPPVVLPPPTSAGAQPASSTAAAGTLPPPVALPPPVVLPGPQVQGMATGTAGSTAGAGATTGEMVAGAVPSAAATAAAATNPIIAAALEAAKRIAAAAAVQAGLAAPQLPDAASQGAARAAVLAAQFAPVGAPAAGAAAGAAAPAAGADKTKPVHFESELVINDFPQKARWKVTHRESLANINESTGAAVIVRGIYVPPGKQPPEGEKKLTLHIEGPTEAIVKHAKSVIKRLVEEVTEKAMRHDAPAMGRYNVT